MAVALALLAALAYGVSDYVGGRASRVRAPLLVTLTAELCLTGLVVVSVPLIERGLPDDARVWWGAAGGAAGSVGVLWLYRSLATGSMTVAAPVTGVLSAVVPVAVGIASGERPAALVTVGIVVAVVAVALIGGVVGALHQPVASTTVLSAVVAGSMFGLLFVAMSRTGETGLWPLVTARVASLPVLVGFYAVARYRGTVSRLDRDALVPGLTVGVLISLASGSYLLSTREGLLAVVAVLVSLYPASTIGLAMLLDRERATRWQVLGMALAALGVGVIAARA